MQKFKLKNQKYAADIGAIAAAVILGGLFFTFPRSVLAARLFFTRQPSVARAGDVIRESVMLDPQGTPVNAIQAVITFSPHLVLLSASDADSVIGEWIERDSTTTANTLGMLSLAGIMPGGYDGTLSAYWSGPRAGKVITLLFRAASAGSATVGIGDPSVLANDGNGTPVPLEVSGDSFIVTSGSMAAGAQESPKAYAPVDVVPPDDFSPLVARDPALFGGKYFVSFSTRDNVSGIVGYQVAESTSKEGSGDYQTLAWHDASSPYVLSDQSLQSYIYVKAIDGAGNTRVVVIPPSPSAVFGGAWWLMAALGMTGIVFVCAVGWYILYRYHKKSHGVR